LNACRQRRDWTRGEVLKPLLSDSALRQISLALTGKRCSVMRYSEASLCRSASPEGGGDHGRYAPPFKPFFCLAVYSSMTYGTEKRDLVAGIIKKATKSLPLLGAWTFVAFLLRFYMLFPPACGGKFDLPGHNLEIHPEAASAATLENISYTGCFQEVKIFRRICCRLAEGFPGLSN
jgi:hypothetical protein